MDKLSIGLYYVFEVEANLYCRHHVFLCSQAWTSLHIEIKGCNLGKMCTSRLPFTIIALLTILMNILLQSLVFIYTMVTLFIRIDDLSTILFTSANEYHLTSSMLSNEMTYFHFPKDRIYF